MLQTVFVDVDPARLACNGALSDEAWRAHRWTHVDHVVLQDDFLAGLHVLEDGFLRIWTECLKVVVETSVDALAIDYFLERFTILFHGEDLVFGVAEHHVHVVTYTMFAEVVFCEIADFLGSSATLHGRVRMRKDRRARLEVLDVIPCAANGPVGVVAAHTVLADGLFQPRNRVPVDLDARRAISIPEEIRGVIEKNCLPDLI